MKYLWMFIFLLSMSFSARSQKDSYIKKEWNLVNSLVIAGVPLNGKVAREKGVVSQRVFLGSDAADQTVYTFSRSGQIIQIENHSANRHHKCLSEFDSLGKLILETCYEDGEISWIFGYAYQKGLLTEEYTFSPDGDTLRNVHYKYNELNKIAAKINEDGETRYSYDSHGNLVDIKYSAKFLEMIEGYDMLFENPVGHYEYEYDSNDSIIASTEYTDEGRIWRQYQLERNEKGYLTKVSIYNTGELAAENTFRYDDSGNLSEDQIQYVRSAWNKRQNFLYDENGLLVKYLSKQGDEILELIFEYELRK